jgi:hypothetical protein
MRTIAKGTHVDEVGQKNWWDRNWFWAVPIGCLSPFLLCGGCLGISLFTVVTAIRASEPYRHAVDTAMASPEVKARFGEPIEIGYWTNGGIEISNNSGKASFSIPIHGSRRSGTIYVEATRDGSDWTYERLDIGFDGGGDPIDFKPKKRPQ